MVKALAGCMVVALIAFAAFYGMDSAPLDSREMIESGINQIRESSELTSDQEHLLRVQIALEDFTRQNGTPPQSLEVLIPKYFDQVPNDPVTSEPYAYVVEDGNYRLGQQVLAAAAIPSDPSKVISPATFEVDGSVLVNPNTLELEIFTYDPDGKRDPFNPFNFSKDSNVDYSVPPLQRYTLGQLKVTAILADSVHKGEMIAIVEDARGKGYTVRKDTSIGNQNGVVVSIEKDRINVVETTVDFTGKTHKRAVVMQIPVRSSGDQGQFNKLFKR